MWSEAFLESTPAVHPVHCLRYAVHINGGTPDLYTPSVPRGSIQHMLYHLCALQYMDLFRSNAFFVLLFSVLHPTGIPGTTPQAPGSYRSKCSNIMNPRPTLGRQGVCSRGSCRSSRRTEAGESGNESVQGSVQVCTGLYIQLAACEHFLHRNPARIHSPQWLFHTTPVYMVNQPCPHVSNPARC